MIQLTISKEPPNKGKIYIRINNQKHPITYTCWWTLKTLAEYKKNNINSGSVHITDFDFHCNNIYQYLSRLRKYLRQILEGVNPLINEGNGYYKIDVKPENIEIIDGVI